eukprot:SAG11_NODE_1983_length_3964_cov_5.135023_5_plen_86_part_00
MAKLPTENQKSQNLLVWAGKNSPVTIFESSGTLGPTSTTAAVLYTMAYGRMRTVRVRIPRYGSLRIDLRYACVRRDRDRSVHCIF